MALVFGPSARPLGPIRGGGSRRAGPRRRGSPSPVSENSREYSLKGRNYSRNYLNNQNRSRRSTLNSQRAFTPDSSVVSDLSSRPSGYHARRGSAPRAEAAPGPAGGGSRECAALGPAEGAAGGRGVHTATE